MNHKEVFSTIINKLLSKYSIKSKLIPTFRFLDKGKTLYIILKFKRKTEYNIYELNDLYFSITLDDKFPDVLPYVRALSSFSFPSLYDNSNLYHSILLFKESNINSKNKDPSLIIDDIISGIPLFLQNIKKNEENKIFYYYGEYFLDEIYDINDYLSDENLKLYRTSQIVKKNEFKRFIILNDVYFLLFDPLPDSNNYAKLVFMSDILLLNDAKKDENGKIVHFEWKNNKNEDIKMTFKFEQKFFNEFLRKKHFKINNLLSHYDMNSNNNYNTNGFQISKSFEFEIIEK